MTDYKTILQKERVVKHFYDWETQHLAVGKIWTGVSDSRCESQQNFPETGAATVWQDYR